MDETIRAAQLAEIARAEVIGQKEGIEGTTVRVKNRDAACKGVVVRLWGAWIMGPPSSGKIEQVTMVQKTDAARDPTLAIEGRGSVGRRAGWVFDLCALRSCGGTAVLVHGQGVVRVCNSVVGGMTGHSPAEYGLTATGAVCVGVEGIACCWCQ